MSSYRKARLFIESLVRLLGSCRKDGGTRRGLPLKWYFCIDEEGTRGQVGLHARLAVLSARQNTQLRPHLITTGFRNDFTLWMEAHGVKLIDARQPLFDVIEAASVAGHYGLQYLGHWLRCEIPLLETEDEFVLYTDCDVVFVRDVQLEGKLPFYFSAAPEFYMDRRDYINSGVMVINVENMRLTCAKFLQHARSRIESLRGEAYHDQYAYNEFYKGAWSHLDVRYNWKPYWGDPDEAFIVHFHGAKLHAIRMMFEQDLPYDQEFWRLVGSLVKSSPGGYRRAITATLDATSRGEYPERAWIEDLARRLSAGSPPIPETVPLMTFGSTRVR